MNKPIWETTAAQPVHNVAPVAKSLREQREEIEEGMKLRAVQRRAKLTEGYVNSDYWLSGYSDMLSRFADGNNANYPIAQPTDRRYGSNYPFWYSESQLSMIRAQARICVTMNPNATGLLNGLTSYVIGSGFKYTVQGLPGQNQYPKLVNQIQKIVDEFVDDNAWDELEQELFWRSREDGEFFLRLFPQANGTLMVRTVEPEQVFQPGGTSLDEWSYGIETDPDDVCNVIAYHVAYTAPAGKDGPEGQGEIVPAGEIIHVKSNVKRAIKRGLSDFSYDTLDTFNIAGKLRRNVGEGASIQAAIAGIRQHDAASAAQVDSFLQTQIDYSAFSPITNGRPSDYQAIQSGSFVDIPKGMNYIQPPGGANVAAHLEAFQALLRSAGNRHNAPEWLVSSDASNNNYASSLTAESPFLRNCIRLQTVLKRPFLKVIKAAIQCRIAAGQLPENALNLVAVQATPPSVEARDKAAEAQANQVYATLGIKSPQTITHEIGLDWDEETANREELSQRDGTTSPLPMEPIDDGGDEAA